MPIRYRRRIPVTRDSWLNFSLRGLSASTRILGRVTVNSRGRVTVRGPKGWSWRS